MSFDCHAQQHDAVVSAGHDPGHLEPESKALTMRPLIKKPNNNNNNNNKTILLVNLHLSLPGSYIVNNTAPTEAMAARIKK